MSREISGDKNFCTNSTIPTYFQPGTQLVLTPTLAMPLLRYPPTGLDANLTISTPFTRMIDVLVPIYYYRITASSSYHSSRKNVLSQKGS